MLTPYQMKLHELDQTIDCDDCYYRFADEGRIYTEKYWERLCKCHYSYLKDIKYE